MTPVREKRSSRANAKQTSTMPRGWRGVKLVRKDVTLQDKSQATDEKRMSPTRKTKQVLPRSLKMMTMQLLWSHVDEDPQVKDVETDAVAVSVTARR